MTRRHTLPDLPPRLDSALRAAAETLTAIAHDEGLELSGPEGQTGDYLVTMMYLLQQRCLAAEREPQPYLSDETITPQEIAAMLETIGHMLMSDETMEFAGRNPSWFLDAARVVERLAQARP